MCYGCNGKGTTTQSEETDYHNHIVEHWELTCHKCHGSGRLIETTEITYQPWITPKSGRPKNG